MANSKIEITFVEIPVINEYLKFNVNGVTLIETWKTARTTNLR